MLPTDEMAGIAQPAPDRIRGSIGYGKAALAYSRGEATPPDIEGSFNVGPLAPPVDGGDTDAGRIRAHFAANSWPELWSYGDVILNYIVTVYLIGLN